MNQINLEKIRALLSDNNVDFVNQAFELWLTFANDVESFLEVLGLDTSSASVETVQNSTEPFAQRATVLRWVWKQLEGFGVDWAINRQRKYAIQIGEWMYDSQSFSSYIQKIDEAAYNYWKDKPTDEVIRYCYDVTSEDNNEFLPLNTIEEFRAFKPDIPADAHMMPGEWNDWEWTPYAFSSEGCGWSVSPGRTEVFIYEELWGSGWPSDNSGAVLIWSGDRSALNQHDELSFVPENGKCTIIREDEYFVELIQGECVAEVFTLLLTEDIDFAKLTFSERFDLLGGVCFDVVEYAGEKITESTMDYGDSHYGITNLKLHKGLPQYSE